MADKKISALTAATTPLAGTEVLPIVQSGETVKVAVSDLTAGRTVTASQVNVVSTSSTSTLYLESQASGLDGGWNYVQSVNVSNGSNDLVVQSRSAYVTSEKFRFKAAGDFNVGVGNVVIGTSGKGIDFSATPGTGTSELFADYEEGTWTPVVASSIGAITSYAASGKYTKIGRAVVLSCNIIITNNGTGAGYLSITGVPFSAAAANAEAGVGAEYGAVGFQVYEYFLNTTTLAMASYINAYPGGTNYRIAAEITYQV